MTASTPPLVDVIAEVLWVHVKRNIKGCDCGWAELGKDHRDHQARAVLDTLTKAGGVEWGVQLSDGSVEEHYSQSSAEDTCLAYPSTEAVVSRITGPWEQHHG